MTWSPLAPPTGLAIRALFVTGDTLVLSTYGGTIHRSVDVSEFSTAHDT